MPKKVPRTTLLVAAELYPGVPEGVYGCVRFPDIYFRKFYDSQAASSVRATAFAEVRATGWQQFGDNHKQRPQKLKPFKYDSLLVSDGFLASLQRARATLQSPEEELSVLQLLEEPVVMEAAAVPETYLTAALVRQLQVALGATYSISTQRADTHVLPFNQFFKSRPDIVIDTRQAPHGTITATVQLQPHDGDMEGKQLDGGVTAELKTAPLLHETARSQLYAEAFNVLTTKFARLVQATTHSVPTQLAVFCILLYDNCTTGTISKLSVNFDSGLCQIREDPTTYAAHECFNRALAALYGKEC